MLSYICQFFRNDKVLPYVLILFDFPSNSVRYITSIGFTTD